MGVVLAQTPFVTAIEVCHRVRLAELAGQVVLQLVERILHMLDWAVGIAVVVVDHMDCLARRDLVQIQFEVVEQVQWLHDESLAEPSVASDSTATILDSGTLVVVGTWFDWAVRLPRYTSVPAVAFLTSICVPLDCERRLSDVFVSRHRDHYQKWSLLMPNRGHVVEGPASWSSCFQESRLRRCCQR